MAKVYDEIGTINKISSLTLSIIAFIIMHPEKQ